MRILYGVQGTGNGHLSRARHLGRALRLRGAEVDFLFSGRAPENYFDMQEFTRADYRHGASFVVRQGRLDRWQTVKQLRPLQTLREMVSLHPEHYDLVLSDYEPLTAWAARYRGVRCLGIGHQYALTGKAPLPGGDPLARQLLKHFAPGSDCLGLHWHRFNDSTLPPIIDHTQTRQNIEPRTVVYLPFFDLKWTLSLLDEFTDHSFAVFSPQVKRTGSRGHVQLNPLSVTCFRDQLNRAQNVVCHTGFELISEALHLGIPVLTQPLPGQYEQSANAMALDALGLATTARQLNPATLASFIGEKYSHQETQRYPDVAGYVADFCLSGADGDLSALAETLWAATGGQASQSPLSYPPMAA